MTFDFQMASGAWNWIRVTSPKDASVEEVAKTLYGDETRAYLLTPAPPLFGFPDVDTRSRCIGIATRPKARNSLQFPRLLHLGRRILRPPRFWPGARR